MYRSKFKDNSIIIEYKENHSRNTGKYDHKIEQF